MPEKESFNGTKEQWHEKSSAEHVLGLGRGFGAEERGKLFLSYIDEIIKRVKERDKDISYIPLLENGLKYFHAHNRAETSRQTFKDLLKMEKRMVTQNFDELIGLLGEYSPPMADFLEIIIEVDRVYADKFRERKLEFDEDGICEWSALKIDFQSIFESGKYFKFTQEP